MKRLIALSLGIAATSAIAQATGSAANPDAGFFRPSDLAVPQAPAAPRVPANVQLQRAATALVEETREVEEVKRAEAEIDRTERQMDRIERENERARDLAPAPITGAFTGLTSERDR
jgi:hypothetical protein